MDALLKGKVALVTGGAKGIGKAIVEAYAKEGANVAFTYKSSKAEAEAFVSELKAKGYNTIGIQADAVDFASVKNSVDETIKAFGALHILVCNAGITRDNLLLRMTEEQWDAVINNNLKSVFNYVKVASRPMMSQRYGRIITLSSVVGLGGNAGQANYSASKAGIIGFTKSIAKELASRNILANVIAPGWIDTDMTHELTEEQKKTFFATLPMARGGKPEEVAGVALFLASDLSSYVTGEIIRVDGGLAM